MLVANRHCANTFPPFVHVGQQCCYVTAGYTVQPTDEPVRETGRGGRVGESGNLGRGRTSHSPADIAPSDMVPEAAGLRKTTRNTKVLHQNGQATSCFGSHRLQWTQLLYKRLLYLVTVIIPCAVSASSDPTTNRLKPHTYFPTFPNPFGLFKPTFQRTRSNIPATYITHCNTFRH